MESSFLSSGNSFPFNTTNFSNALMDSDDYANGGIGGGVGGGGASNSDYFTPFELFLAVLTCITYSITMIVGIIGNSLVLLTVLLQPKMQSTTNILILNLAIAELLFILICVPFTGVNYVLRYVYLLYIYKVKTNTTN